MLTIKVSVCAWCNGYLDTVELRGKDALEGASFIVSHGQCAACAKRMKDACEAPQVEITLAEVLDSIYPAEGG